VWPVPVAKAGEMPIPGACLPLYLTLADLTEAWTTCRRIKLSIV
jgi:hypothetical protein